MTPDKITEIIEAMPEVDVFKHGDDLYYYYDPHRNLPKDGRFPFATLMTSDAYDHASNLARPGIFRLNIGVYPGTYREMFGPPPTKLGEPAGVDTGHDYTALNQFMPHPVYAAMSWICILNPADDIVDQLTLFLKQAHELAATSFQKRAKV